MFFLSSRYRLWGCIVVMMAGIYTPFAHADDMSDPFESYNRAIFSFNNKLDRYLIEPVAKGYRTVVPRPVRTGAHNVLTNLKSPLTIGNNLLQGDLSGAGDATVRMVVNTLLGIGGIFDIAGSEGIKDEPEDFGQTLAVWGVGHGPYIVPPILPPGSLRDLSGNIVDIYADPVRLWFHNTDRDGLAYFRTGLGFLDTRTELLDTLSELRRGSVDYYATIRSAYTQRRDALVRDVKTSPDMDNADIPVYD
jgi:phospholipid-binding lipoprotein MlaA